MKRIIITLIVGLMTCTLTAVGNEQTDSLSRQLENVTVTASPIEQINGKTRIQITRQMRKGKMSTGQLIGDLPNFHYDYADRNVTFNNSSNIVVLVDSIEKPNADVFNLQHMRFDRIEIVRNPTGKYQGYDVLINFHTKDNYEGHEGQLYHNNMMHFNKYNGSTLNVDNERVSFAYTRNKWNIYARGRYYWGTGKYDLWSEKKFLFNGIEENVIPNPDGSKNTTGYEWNADGYISVDYAFDKKSSMSAVYTYTGSGNRQYQNKYMNYIEPLDNIDETLHRDNRSYNKGEEHSVGLFYRNYNGKVQFDTDLNYRYLPSSLRNSITDNGTTDINNRFRDRMHLLRFRINASTDWNDGSMMLTWGYQSNWKKYERIGYDNDDVLNTNSYLRNRLNVGFGYFLSNMNFQIEPWIEVVHLKSNGMSENQYPVGATAVTYWQMTQQNWMRLMYTCSTSYPDQGQSSEWGYFTDPYIWQGGNPFLKSSVNHSISYWIDLFGCFNFQCGYNFAPDSFTSIGELREGMLPSGAHGKYVAYTTQNSDFKRVWGSVSFTKRFKKHFVYKADFGMGHNKASWEGYSNSGNYFSFRTSINYYNNPARMNFNLGYQYDRMVNPTPQTMRKSNWEYPSLSISKYCLKNNALEISLSYTGFFKLFNGDTNTWTKNPGLESHTLDHTSARQGQRLSIGISYRFNGGKSVRQYNRSLSTEN
mgnify:CR=1 FL=1